LFAAALALLCLSQVASAQTQVPVEYFTGPDNHLVNFDTDPASNPIAAGALLQNTYAAIGVHFDANDRAAAQDAFGTSPPNQATGSANELESINVYFDRPVDAVGAWGYDFALRAFDANGNVVLEVSYTDGHPCPEPGNFREQRFLGIAAGSAPIVQAQFSRFFQDQTDCGFRIDDLQYLQSPPPPPPTPIAGNIQLNWNNCSGGAGASPYTVFDCDPNLGSIYSLVGTFQVMSPFANMIAMDASFDIILDGQTGMAPFWHFETGGCNALGLSIDDSKPVACTNYLTPWGSGGASSDALITAYQPGVSFGNYGRLLISVARSSDDPINLGGAPNKYFGWNLLFNMEGAGTCAGCNQAASVRVNAMRLYDQSAGAGNQIDQNGPGSQPCVSINGGSTGCNPTPTTHHTWGQLKSLYR
jgi:hypothetical protein